MLSCLHIDGILLDNSTEVKNMFSRVVGNTKFLEKALDSSWMRHEAISQNISNVDTPKYKKVSVEFEDQLKNEMIKKQNRLHITNDRHIPNVGYKKEYSPNVKKHDNYSYRFDGNNVNIDVEQADLAKNTIMYNALAQSITDEY